MPNPLRSPAIVMGLDVSGYGVVRSLARERIPVVGLWRRADESGRFSHYCTAIRIPAEDDDAWVKTLMHVATRYDRPVVFPTSDRHTHLLARHQEALRSVMRFHWVSPDALDAAIEKSRIAQTVARLGIPVPRTYRPKGPDIAAEAATFVYPCVVKPLTALHGRLPGKFKALTCHTPAALVALYEREPGLQDTTLWQELIEGEDDAIYQGTALCVSAGEAAAMACMRKIRQFDPGFGITSYGRTEWDEQVVAQTTVILRALGWTGIASIEFKRSARDGRYYFIELNPRVPWYNVLFADAGINLPYLCWQALTGSRPGAPRQRDGVAWLSFASDLASVWRRSRSKRGGGVRAWLGSVARARSFSWFDRADPLPALAATARWPRLAWRFMTRWSTPVPPTQRF